MTFSISPPVGTPIPTSVSRFSQSVPSWFNAPGVALLQSGTAALAMALHVCKQANCSNTEVIIPAYGCPDLVSAVLHAELTPVVVDVSLVPYGFKPEALEQSVTSQTIAIVCPTLFGIRMNCAELKRSVGDNIKIIEDNAQWFPSSRCENTQTTELARHGIFDDSFASADLSIISFGRGKPVNLMGGGALFLHNEQLLPDLNRALEAFCISTYKPSETEQASISTGYIIKTHIFNALCTPFLYGIVSQLPFLSIGATVFHPLESIEQLNSNSESLMNTAIQAYLNTEPMAEKAYRKAWPNNQFVLQSNYRLLRYPLLVDSAHLRDRLISKLLANGIGASPFYNAILTNIEGVEAQLKRYAPITNAELLATNMLTLPTHTRLSQDEVSRCISIIDDTPDMALGVLE